MRIAGTIKHSLVNGPGIRYVIFFQGCTHKCTGCHNPETHNLNGGVEVSEDTVIDWITHTKHIDGVTFSGGDPLLQADSAIRIADAAHGMGLSVWCYTGYTLEQILDGQAGRSAVELLDHIDCLIDGPYIESLRSEYCIYRGSTNQRLIYLPIERSTQKGGTSRCFILMAKKP